MTTAIIRRLFHPSKHVWLRATPRRTSAAELPPGRVRKRYGAPNQIRKRYDVEIGLTERGLEDVGYVTATRAAVSERTPVRSGRALLQVEWEGYSLSDADELYHAIWTDVSGATPVDAPVAGVVEGLNLVPQGASISDDTVLVRMDVADYEWESLKPELVERAEYLEIVRTIPPGRFAEAREE